jgi:hypothetical protein
VKILKSAIGSLIALGAYGVPQVAHATFCVPAGANTSCVSRHPGSIIELHATNAGGSGSFAAAAVMGAEGFSAAPQPVDFETTITSGCTALTKSLAAPPIGSGPPGAQLSVWPSTCNPDGMSLFLNQFSPPNPPGEPAVHWITFKTTDQTAVNNELIRGLKDFGSPGIIPVYGQADHFVAVTQVIVNSAGTILNVRAFDGGKVGDIDSGFNSYFSGLQSWGTTAFLNTFFKVVTAINPSCDSTPGGGCGAPPVNDPFANKYVLMYEPPPSGTRTSALSPSAWAAPNALVAKGTMNASIAQTRMVDALVAGGISSDPDLWNGIKGGTPGTAVLVNALWPSGAAYNYYLVPILSSSNTNTVIGFAQLDAATGAFQSVNLLSAPQTYTPVSLQRAQDLAASQLAPGESLTGGVLTWNPRANTGLAKSPNAPYFEFGVAGSKTAAVRVRLADGLTVRSN